MELLNGVKVVELSRLIPGPALSVLLADLGAEVVKVEEPKIGDYFRISNTEPMGAQFVWLNRNKRSAGVDFMQPEGLKIVYDMVRQADIVIDGSRPGGSEKIHLGYEDLKKVNPKIVFCAITGFGQDGPFAHLGTHGGAYDAVTGMAVPFQLEDGSYVQHRPYPHALLWGVWLGAMATTAALYRAKMTGKGTFLDISCSDAAVMALGQELVPMLNGGDLGWPDPNTRPLAVKYCYYKTKDDKFMLIQTLEKQFWQKFCDVVGRPDLRDRGDWSVSIMDSAVGDLELREELIKIFATKTQDEWTDIFITENIAGAPYYPIEDLESSRLTKARNMIVDYDHPLTGKMRIAANAIKIPGDPFTIDRPAPTLGQQTDEVLAEYGFDKARIAEFRERGLLSPVQ